MLLFNFIGEALLNQLEVSEITVRLTSGLILVLFAIGVLFSSSRNLRSNLKTNEEPLIVPLAIPLIAGPALLATIMLYAAIEEDVVCQLTAILPHGEPLPLSCLLTNGWSGSSDKTVSWPWNGSLPFF